MISQRNEDSKIIVPLLPLRDVVVFPYMIVPLFVGREKSINALESAMKQEKEIFLVAQKSAQKDEPTEDDIYQIGTIGVIIQLLRLPDGTVKALVEGKKRATVREYIPNPDHFVVEIDEVPETGSESAGSVQAVGRVLVEAFKNYAKLSQKIQPELVDTIAAIDNAAKLSDVIASHLGVKLEKKQALLEITDGGERLEKLYSMIVGEIEILELEEKIKRRVKKQMEKTQKDYYLNEQMRAIQKEMGDKDDFSSEIEELEKSLKEKKLSEEAQKKVKQEIKKLKMMSPMSAEATVVRNYIDWLLDMPWSEKTENKHTLKESEAILEEDHYGLKKVKERILEYLAVQTLVKKNKGPILCLVGPPGVGKTSIAKSIARATNRKFVRLSLGGLRDEAEIRGHRRTYIGALPGKIIQLLKKAGSNNPVFCLDEVDKLSSDFRGDPSSALLEVLDPGAEQCLQRQLSGSGLRSFRHHVHHDGKRSADDPGTAAGPDGSHPDCRVHGTGKAQHRKAVPREERDRGQRAQGQEHPVYRRCDPGDHPQVHARGGRPEPRERNRLHLPESGQERS